MASSVDGLISGLGTTDLINQLMQLERQPQNRLVQKKAAVDAKVAVYQTLNTRFAGVRDAAAELTKADGWQATKATSSSSGVTATSSPTALSGSLSFTVERLASAHSLISEKDLGATTDVVATGPLTINVGGVDKEVAVGGGTLAEVVTAINAAGIGVSAAAVQVDTGTFRLQLTSATTGDASAFTVDPANLAALQGDGDAEAFNVVTTGVDAQLKVGGATGYTVERPTNTFADVLPGLTFTVSKVDAVPVTVSVAADGGALADKVAKLVEAVNQPLTYIKLQSLYNAETKAGGPLLGDATGRQVEGALRSALRDLPAGRTLGDVGLSITADGMLSLDRAKFTEAYAKDPAAVASLFTTGADDAVTTDDGLAAKLEAMAKGATSTEIGRPGTITAAIEGRKSAATGLVTQIEAWDSRLAKKELSLRRTYTGLETALSNLKNQSSWLSGALAGLPAWNS